MAADKIVFLSDIHIGNDSPTNWYQSAVHEPLLLAIFDHVLAQADSVAELVILGDLVDQWAYLPEERPPTFAEIAARQPRVLGAGTGALARVLAAMPGRVTYLPGNHDIGVTAADFAAVYGDAARGLRVITDRPIYEPPAGRGRIGCTHGHIYSVFNAPDPVSDPVRSMPFGHYFMRLLSLYARRELGAGQTVADLAMSGNPTGMTLLADAVKGIIQEFLTREFSLSHAITNMLLTAVGEGPTLEFVLADESRITAQTVADRYAGLYESWSDGARRPRDLYGRDPGVMALVDVDMRNDLAHFAAILAARYDVVVMGHTHVPVDHTERPALLGRHSLYVNPGFDCPSRPDMIHEKSPARATFAEVSCDGDTFSTSIRSVIAHRDGFVVAPPPPENPGTVSTSGREKR